MRQNREAELLWGRQRARFIATLPDDQMISPEDRSFNEKKEKHVTVTFHAGGFFHVFSPTFLMLVTLESFPSGNHRSADAFFSVPTCSHVRCQALLPQPLAVVSELFAIGQMVSARRKCLLAVIKQRSSCTALFTLPLLLSRVPRVQKAITALLLKHIDSNSPYVASAKRRKRASHRIVLRISARLVLFLLFLFPSKQK